VPLVASLFVLPSTTRASAPSVGGISVTTTVQGLRLTHSIPRRAYPRRALVRARLRFRNVSFHTLYYDATNGDAVSVLADRGRLAHQTRQPLGMYSLLTYKGPPRILRLRAGRTVTDHVYLVLYGRFVVAETSVRQEEQGGGRAVRTPRASVHLTNEVIPEVTITTTPRLGVTVTPPWPAFGKLYYLFETSCTTSNGTGSTGKGWTSTAATAIKPVFAGTSTLQPTCAGSIAWNGIVGWLNHPIATFHYRTPARVERSPLRYWSFTADEMYWVDGHVM
jgi:hypothetical protein